MAEAQVVEYISLFIDFLSVYVDNGPTDMFGGTVEKTVNANISVTRVIYV